jgi:molecular chaperone DnaJ
MARIPDLYQVLGVAPDATDDEIKRTYRRLARELHPDVNKDPEAERRFKQITAAYQTLSDPAKRRQYDLFGSDGALAGPDLFPFGDMGDIFDVFFGGGFGGRRRRPRRRTRTQRGGDVFADVSLTFEEAAFGAQKDVTVDSLQECERCHSTGCEPGTYPSRCTRCGGAGEVQDVSRSIFGTVMTARACTVCEGTGEEIAAPCKECRGQGRKPVRQTTAVEIPAGVSDGMQLRVAAGGQEGRQGGGAGDLYFALHVRPHPVFERRGDDLVCGLTVPMTQAALGAEIEISTLDGSETIEIEPGTEPGAVIRLRGHGVPHLGRRGRGDLFVSVAVETPAPRSKDERALLERLAELRDERPQRGKGLAGKVRKLSEQ